MTLRNLRRFHRKPGWLNGGLLLALRDPTTVAETRRLYPLHTAALQNLVEWAENLLDRGAEVDATDREGRTPLMFAAAFRSMEVASLLLAHGADPNAGDGHGDTALHLAAAFGDVPMATLLIENGAEVAARAKDGATPLHYAALYGHPKMITLLIERGAAAHVLDDTGVSALQYATRQNRTQAIALLLKLGARPDTLFDAVNAGDTARVMALVNQGVDVDEVGLFGTPLHVAAAKGYRGIAGVLIDAGADIEAAGEPSGAHPLHVAALNNQVEVAEFLLERGADVDAKDVEGRTPLIVAASFRSAPMAALLLSHGANTMASDATWMDKVLHYAACAGDVEIAALLLSRGRRRQRAEIRTMARRRSTTLPPGSTRYDQVPRRPRCRPEPYRQHRLDALSTYGPERSRGEGIAAAARREAIRRR